MSKLLSDYPPKPAPADAPTSKDLDGAAADNPPTAAELAGDDTAAAPADKPPAKPKPGQAGYDWSAHYDTDDLYTHTFPDGTIVALKSMRTIYSRTWLYKLRKAQSDAEFEFAAIDRAACPEAIAVLEGLDDDIDGDPIADLFKAWSADATGRAAGDDKGLTRGN